MTDNIKLPPLPDEGILDNEIRVWTTLQLQAYAAEAVRLNAGAVPAGWRDALEDAIEALEWHASGHCEDSMPELTMTALQKLRAALSASQAPEPQGVPAQIEVKPVAQVISYKPLEHTAVIKWFPAVNMLPPKGFNVGEMLYLGPHPQPPAEPAQPQQERSAEDESELLTIAHLDGYHKGVADTLAKLQQQERKPLTVEEIRRERSTYEPEDAPEGWAFREGVRFAERHHGITSAKDTP